MSFTLRQLRTFVAVAEAGSVSHAAQVLSISQSAVSEAVKDLEADLGVRLFDRHARGLSVTQRGHQFLRHARDILAQVQASRRVIAGEEREALRGTLQLGVTSLMAGYVMSICSRGSGGRTRRSRSPPLRIRATTWSTC